VITKESAPNSKGCTISDSKGQFRFALPDAGERVRVSARGYLATELPNTAQDRRVTITLESGGVEVAGTVVDASGGPVIGALVTGCRDISGCASTLTDSAGAYQLGVTQGWIDLTAEAQAYSRTSLRVQAPAVGVSLVIAPASIINGIVFGDDDVPLADMTVSAWPEGAMPGGPVVVKSQPDGTFKILDVAPGQYALEAIGEQFRSRREAAFVGVAQASTTVVLRAEPAVYFNATLLVDEQPCEGAYATVSGPIEVVRVFDASGQLRIEGLVPGRYEVSAECPSLAADIRETVDVAHEPITRTWSMVAAAAVRGQVITPSGRAVVGVTVEVRPVGEPAARRTSMCSTDGAGEFLCAGLASGAYSARVSQYNLTASDEVSFDIGNGRVPSVVLETPGVGTVRVVVDGSGRDCVGSCGTVTPVIEGERDLRLYGEADGEHFVFRDLPFGPYTVSVGSDARRVVVTHDEEMVEVHIASPPRGSVRGRVVDTAGQPLPDVWVNVARTQPEWLMATVQIPPTMSESDGSFVLDGLVPGRYSIEATHDGTHGQLGLVGPGDPAVVLRLEPGVPANDAHGLSVRSN
jgi:hypothetical protein